MRAAATILLVLWPHVAAAEDPVARLAPIWTDSFTVASHAIDHGQLLALGNEVRVYDLADGYTSTPVYEGGAAPVEITVSGTRFATATMTELAAWQRMPLDSEPKQLWVFDPKARIEAIAIDDLRAYAQIVEQTDNHPQQRAVIAVSLASGKQVWRLDLPVNAAPTLLSTEPSARGVIAGRIANENDTQGLRTFAWGFERATGAKVWQYTGPPSSALATNHRSLVVARSDQLTVVDRVTGLAVDTELPVPIDAPELAVTEDLAALAGSSDDGGYVVAVDLKLRRPRIVEHAPVMPATPVAIGGPVIYVESPGGVLRAVDRYTGAHRWEWSVGTNISLHTDGDRVIAFDTTGITVFAPGAPPPAQDATIRGKAMIECSEKKAFALLVGDTRITTALDGSYTAHVHARGTVGIRFAEEGASSAPVVVPLVGHTRYHAPVLQTSFCGGD